MARLNEPETVNCREAARQVRFVETSFGDTFPRATYTPAGELRRRSSMMFVAPEVDKDSDTRTFDHEDASPDDFDDRIIAPPAHDDDPEDDQRTEEEPTADDLVQQQLAEEEERYASSHDGQRQGAGIETGVNVAQPAPGPCIPPPPIPPPPSRVVSSRGRPNRQWR